ncbi:MAG: BatD family protein [Bacteroidota bacterium]
MKKLLIFAAAFLLSNTALRSQEATFTINVSTDSVLIGNYFKVTFTLEGAAGRQFDPPSFTDFNIVGGPNQSSSMSFVNGEMSQSQSYSFYLEPKEEGSFFIEPSSIQAGEQIMETLPMEIRVYPNPDGIQQMPDQPQRDRSFFSFPSPWQNAPIQPMIPREELEPKAQPDKKKKKKKRKIYKI